MRKTFWSDQRPTSSRRKLGPVIWLGVILTTIVAIAAAEFRASRGDESSERAIFPGAVVIPTQTVRFTIYPEGIHPATAIAHQGVISIAIEDLAGAESGVLVERLKGSEHTPVSNLQGFQRHWRGRSSIEVTPGIYRLQVPGRQIEEAQLTVEP